MSVLIADTYVWYYMYKGKYDTNQLSTKKDRFASTLINVEELLSTPNNKSKVCRVLYNAIKYTIYKPKYYSLLLIVYEWFLRMYIRIKGNKNIFPPFWLRWLYEISLPKHIEGFLIGTDAMVELSKDLNPSIPIAPFLTHENDYIQTSQFVANICQTKCWERKKNEYKKEVFERWHKVGMKIRKKRKIFKWHLDHFLQELHENSFIKQNDDYTKLLPVVEEYLCTIVILYNLKVIRCRFNYPKTYCWPKKRLLVHFTAMTFYKYLKGSLGKCPVTLSGKISVDENDINDLLNFCYHKPGYIYFIGEKRWKTMYDELVKFGHDDFPADHAIKDVDYFK